MDCTGLGWVGQVKSVGYTLMMKSLGVQLHEQLPLPLPLLLFVRSSE